MSKFSLIYKCRLIEALGELKSSGLFGAAGSALKTALIESIAVLYGVGALDLHNYALLDADFLREPAYPSGCSVGGGITRLFFNLKDYKKHKNEIIEHNLRLIWSVFDITAEGSAAGYDSHGITLAALNLKTGATELVREKTSGDIDERGYITISNLLKKCPEIETGDALVLVTGAQTRAATQGDNMYSRANAHLHNERMTREIFNDAMNSEELERFRRAYPLVINRDGPFCVGHNGDVNSKIKWEKYFLNMGFETKADSDSKEIPRIIRIVYECLMAEEILKAEGRFLGWFMDTLFYNQVLSERAKFEIDGAAKIIGFEEQKRLVTETAEKAAFSLGTARLRRVEGHGVMFGGGQTYISRRSHVHIRIRDPHQYHRRKRRRDTGYDDHARSEVGRDVFIPRRDRSHHTRKIRLIAFEYAQPDQKIRQRKTGRNSRGLYHQRREDTRA